VHIFRDGIEEAHTPADREVEDEKDDEGKQVDGVVVEGKRRGKRGSDEKDTVV
jgi:hypothetical protein